MIIQEPKFVVIMMELIKHTASNKLKTMKKTIKDKHQTDFDKLQRSSDFYSQPSEPQISCYNCQYRFNAPQGAISHKRAFNCNKNHINMFLDDFVLRHYNTTEAEKQYIKDTIMKANKFGSTKHYEEAYQNLINTFWSQIKYSLTSLQPCIYLKEDRDLIKNLIMGMLNFKEDDVNVEKEDIIDRVLHFLESAKVRQNNKYIFDVWKHSQCTVLKSTDSDFLENQNASQQKFDLGICKKHPVKSRKPSI